MWITTSDCVSKLDETYERRQAVPLHSAPRTVFDVDPFSITLQEAYDCPNTLHSGDL
jgi:hypothetical protein